MRIGAFHEAVNIAMFLKLPVIFIIENNGYAMGTSVSRTSNVTELYKSGLSYEIPSEPVDAMNVVKVHRAISKAAKRGRKGDGPTLLEFRTYRFKGHSMSDPAKYRTKEELDEIKIEGIINLDFYSEEFEKGLLNLDRDKTYYLICRSGRRSGIATSFMRDNGFKEAYNIKGGMIEWENSNLSLEIKKGH